MRIKGVLFIVKNYAGDVMNFAMAGEMLSIENVTVMTSDDCAVINSIFTDGRRDVAGAVIVEKCIGSIAETGADLATCKALGDKINTQTASIGVAFTSCTAPAAGKPTFEISETEIEMGVAFTENQDANVKPCARPMPLLKTWLLPPSLT